MNAKPNIYVEIKAKESFNNINGCRGFSNKRKHFSTNNDMSTQEEKITINNHSATGSNLSETFTGAAVGAGGVDSSTLVSGGVAANSSSSTKTNTPATSAAAVAAAAAATSSTNKFSIVNINSQFKGKSIEPQAKTTVVRVPHGGMQTLGKAVAARRMPPPTNLPSLAKSTGGITLSATPATSNATNSTHQSVDTPNTNNSNVSANTLINNSNLTASHTVMSGVGGVSGSTLSWPTPSQQSNIDSSSAYTLSGSSANSIENNSNNYYSNMNTRGNTANENTNETNHFNNYSYNHNQQQHNQNKWSNSPAVGVHLKQEVRTISILKF